MLLQIQQDAANNQENITKLQALLDLLVQLAEKSTYAISLRFLFDAIALHDWMQKNLTNNKSSKRPVTLCSSLFVAHGHLTIWKAYGTAFESYNLLAAKEMFRQHFSQNPEWENPYDYVEYFRCLLYYGEFRDAADLIRQILVKFELDPYFADYCFYAGVVFKALREYETANNYFFDAIQNGPPRYFTKIEMMTVISRNLEEMNAEIDEDTDNAYHMVSLALA